MNYTKDQREVLFRLRKLRDIGIFLTPSAFLSSYKSLPLEERNKKRDALAYLVSLQVVYPDRDWFLRLDED